MPIQTSIALVEQNGNFGQSLFGGIWRSTPRCAFARRCGGWASPGAATACWTGGKCSALV